MSYKAVLLYQDVPIEEWPPDVNGNFIYKIVDLPVSNQVPDSRPWRLWTRDQANQYSKELEDDFERNDEMFGKLSVDKQIKLALRRAEKFGNELFEEFKKENVLDGLTKKQVRKLDKDLREISSLLRGGSLKALLDAMAEVVLEDPDLPPETPQPEGAIEGLTLDRVLRYGNAVRQYLGLEPVETQAELDDGVI